MVTEHSVKIIRRNRMVWNSLGFAVLTPLFLHVVTCLIGDVSSFDWGQLLQTVLKFKILFGIAAFSLLMIWRVSKWSVFFLFILWVYTLLLSFYSLYGGFNKLVLVMTFAYAILGHYFVIFWREELEEAYYRSLLGTFEIKRDASGRLVGKLFWNEHDFCDIFLTNWSRNGCFVCVQGEPEMMKQIGKKKFFKFLIRRKLQLEFFSGEHRFHSQGKICSLLVEKSGMGIRFREKELSGTFSWKGFFEILSERGLTPF